MTGADLLRDNFDALIVELVGAIAQQIPDANTGLDAPLGRQRQKVLYRSLAGMVAELDARHGRPRPAEMDWREHRELGRMEYRHARPITEILKAPWAASHTIFRYAVDRAEPAGLTPADLHEIAEVVIEWSDRISREFSTGYNDEQAARAGETETRRRHLIELVVADPSSSADTVASAARAAGWRPVSEVRVLIAQGDNRNNFRRGLPPGTAAAEIGDEVYALLAAPRSEVGLEVSPPTGNTLAAIGPPFPLAAAHASARIARRALSLARQGILPGKDVIDCAEHELILLVMADQDLAHRFSERLLAPLDDTTLTETLAAWLAQGGRLKPSATKLNVHPHTVTYRLNRLRELLGSSMDDPDQRLDVHLATYIRRIRTQT